MRRNRGSILGGFLGLVGFLVLSFGVTLALEVNRNPRATEMTLQDYLQKRPPANWLRLTDCQLNLQAAVYEYAEEGGEVLHVYIPVHPPGEAVPAAVVIDSVEHAGLVAGALEVQDDEEALELYLKENEEKFKEITDVEGWLTHPSEAVASQLDADEVAPDYKVLEVGRVKTWSEALAPGGLGLLLLLGSYLLLRRR